MREPGVTPNRRTFLSTLGGFAALGSTAGAQSTPAPPPAAGGIDIRWFDAFQGKHKQVFDCGTFDLSSDSPLRQPGTYLAAHRELNHLEPPDDLNVIMGVSHRAFPMNANDAMWQKYRLGELWHITDPATRQPAIRNIFAGAVTGATGATVRALQARGVIFWQCNFALGSVSSDIADAIHGKAADIRADLGANLLPGVRLVPAHTWALGYVQERGFAYEKLDAR
jgi:intracellular sulfur oxidation DsrE/DsrF family protein